MPHEILKLVLSYVEKTLGPQTQQMQSSWELIVRWCIVASQRDAQGESLVAFLVEAITEGDDAYFSQWVEQRIDGTLGKGPTHGGPQSAPQEG